MKKSIEIPFHALLWVLIATLTLIQAELFLKVSSDAAFADRLSFVIFLDIVISLIFFYSTYMAFPWVSKSKKNQLILTAILLMLLIIFALPAMNCGLWQVLSSLVPHLVLILLAIVFRKLFVVI
jgi:hypothetical protein